MAANNNDSLFAYTGQIFLPEIGLYHFKARQYNPSIGRFMQTDPIGYEDQMNLYAYVANDPINLSDPTGEQIFPRSNDNNFYQNFINGIAGPAQGLGAIAEVTSARALGVRQNEIQFIDNTIVLGVMFIVENPMANGSLLVDQTLERPVAEQLGSLLTGSIVTRRLGRTGFVRGFTSGLRS